MKRILIILLLAVVAFPAFAQMGSNSHTLADLLTTAAESEENTPKQRQAGRGIRTWEKRLAGIFGLVEINSCPGNLQ